MRETSGASASLWAAFELRLCAPADTKKPGEDREKETEAENAMRAAVNRQKVVDRLADAIQELNRPCAARRAVLHALELRSASADSAAERGANASLPAGNDESRRGCWTKGHWEFLQHEEQLKESSGTGTYDSDALKGAIAAAAELGFERIVQLMKA